MTTSATPRVARSAQSVAEKDIPRAGGRASSQAPGRTRSARRIEGLDGIRALAIVAVLVFHLNAPWLPGGFLGVDVFFVVSGFLITTLLVREHERTGRIGFRDFWVRRARRLVPALVVTVTVSTLIARLVSADLLVHVGRQIVGALTFSTNWVEITAGSSYFDQTAPQLFMNFWSLAVEEQFYLAWPALTLLLVTVATARTRVAAALGIAIVSTVLMAVLVEPGVDATRVYYGTDTHLMGLMIGAALAFAWASPALALRIRPSLLGLPGRLAVPVAATTLLACLLLLDESDIATFRGGILLASLASGVLVLGVLDRVPGRGPTLWQRVTGHPVAVWVGVRSYSIYLWHWPVILLVARDNPSAPGTVSHLLTRAWCVLVTLALADLTHRLVETPFRRHGFRGVLRVVGDHLLSWSRRTRQVVAATTVTATLALAFVVLTAPDQSETARMLEANEAAAAARAAVADPAQAGRVAPTGTAKTPSSGATSRAPSTTTPARTPGTGSAGAPAVGEPTANTSVDPADAKPDFTMPTGKEIDGYGDSMMVGSIHALDYYFPGIRMDTKSNRRWSDALTAVKARGEGNRRAVVLAFGTNAGVEADDVRAVLDVLGPDRMVVLVNLMGPFARIDDDNAALEAIARTRPNVVVADWAAAVRDHPEQLQSDRIHPSLKGSHLFAKTVRQALATLSERHTGKAVPLKDLPMP
ncbi:acyltransferase family protein [Intrasporangium sp.]|uniref:acyltransferase family protein n=1 Tax=Intrasporangium sp. TaxID=1925024 RepID=UPI00293A2CBE|nr:acyltransferase family protein [Intrasporangium sp.]MDV3221518.1 acyltransferase [Intrasporangium sp.]